MYMNKQQQEGFDQYLLLDKLSSPELTKKIKETISNYETDCDIKYLKNIEMICDILKSRILS